MLDVEARLIGSDGQYRRFLIRASPLHDENGLAVKWYGANTDIEDSRRAEEALRRAQAQLAYVSRVKTTGELLASIAHEVNQPIAAVVTNASAGLRWLEGKEPNLDEARRALIRIVQEGNRAGEVVRKLRSLMKNAPPQMEPLDINDLIRDVVTLMGNAIGNGGVSLLTELSADIPPVPGDRIQLQQVMSNLILNGIEAVGALAVGPKKISISSNRQGTERVLVAVRDSGVGINPRDADQLFDPFFTTKPEGMGMGLSISRSIVEAHGGQLWVTANEDGGATFQFTLPAGETPG
jgi:C4-dicarboxylate-specific signal transduction histidine kinase